MYEVILPNAVPAAVREYNAQIANLGELVTTTCFVVKNAVQPGHGDRQTEFYRSLLGANVPVTEMRVVRTTPSVNWSDSGTEPSYEVSRLFEDEPRHGEVEDLMNALGATAACVRKVQS
jgi:hypothetical protein